MRAGGAITAGRTRIGAELNFVANTLGHLGSERALPALVSALRDERTTSVRKYLVLALGGIGGEIAVEALLGALRDERQDVRSNAISALGDTANCKRMPGKLRIADG